MALTNEQRKLLQQKAIEFLEADLSNVDVIWNALSSTQQNNVKKSLKDSIEGRKTTFDNSSSKMDDLLTEVDNL